MIQVAITLIWLWVSSAAYAAEFWVSKSGSNANDCTAAQNSSTPKLTLASVLTCESAGDTIWIGDGTYTESNIAPAISSGTSSSARTTLRAINRRQVTIAANGASAVAIELQGKSHIAFIGIIFDATGSSNSAIKINTAPSTGLYFDDIEGTGSGAAQGIICGSSTNLIVRNSRFHHNGSDEFDHGGYFSTGCDSAIVENNEFDNNAQLGVQIYHSPVGVTFRGNYIHDNCKRVGASGNAAEMVVANDSHIIERNVVVVGSTCGVGIQVNLNSPTGNTLRHNSVYCTAGNCLAGIKLEAVATNTVVQNNIALGFSTNIQNLGTGTTLTDNVTTGTATDIWTNPSSDDLTLKSGSAAINGGTDIGLAFCSTAPDQGAFERPDITSASISGNVMLVTICNIAPPVQPGTFTVARSGGSPTVTSTSLESGSGGIVRLEVSETCAAAQTWTVSGGATTTDSALVGNQFNQPLHTTTNFAVDSSACDGTGGPPPPGSEEAHYAFENNLNDSSGNGNTATASNTSFTAGRTGQGILTQANVDSHIDTGLLSGHNPSTDHLVVATWVYVDAADLGQTKDIWGVPTGTNQRFLTYRHSGNTWRMSIGATSGTATEFSVVAGWTHVCVKANATTDTATMYINGVAGTLAGASVISSYGSYTFAGDLRFGLPSGFGTSLSGAHIYDDAYIYTSDVSCVDLFNAGTPTPPAATATQAGHRWQGVYQLSGAAENRGSVNAQRTVNKGGAAALMVQISNETGGAIVVQPRFRYNINGGSFLVVPDSPTADGISYWGSSIPSGLNNSVADGPITGSLTHADGITLTLSTAIPTLDMADDTSYTLRGIFLIDAAIGDVVCFKIYDQGGSALDSYTPSEGACVTVIGPQGAGAP